MRDLFNLNNDWIFAAKKSPSLKKNKVMPKLYREVTLPHCLGNDIIYDNSPKAMKAIYNGKQSTFKLGDEDNNKPVQTVMWYRRKIEINSEHADKLLFLEFQGVNGKCVVYINGKKIYDQSVSLLPFRINITRYVRYDKFNLLAVKVDYRDYMGNLPGEPIDNSKIVKFGGIHRNIRLLVKDKVNFTEVDYCGKYAGGTYIYDQNIDKDAADLGATIQMINRSKKAVKANVIVSVLDMKGEPVGIYNSIVKKLGSKAYNTLSCSIHINNPNLWSPNFPYLYTVKCELYSNGELVDNIQFRHGFRTVKVDNRGFLLNGVNTKIFGVNRIEQVPYIGQAMSDRAEYRDAYKIKIAGYNAVRLEGGGHSAAFLDACDELGLMVINAIPLADSIKIYGETKDNIVDAINCMARRDRNHTSVVIWEATPNGDNCRISDRFYMECNSELCKEFAKRVLVLVTGDPTNRRKAKRIDFTVPYTVIDADNKASHSELMPELKGLIKNYGDGEFGENAAGSGAVRNSSVGELLLQSWNYQWSHNRNMMSSNVLGDLACGNIDYLQGNSKCGKYCFNGIMDQYRLPKFSYQFFRSQNLMPKQKMVFAATLWDDANINVLPVYSNCDKVKLYINDELVDERSADISETNEIRTESVEQISQKGKKVAKKPSINSTFWAKKSNKNKLLIAKTSKFKLMVESIYNGGNCDKLINAPFTFRNIMYSAGVLRVEGIIDGEVAATHTVVTPSQVAKRVKISVDYSAKELIADKNDFVFIHAEMQDEHGGIIRNFNSNQITFSIKGGEIIGNNIVTPIGGIASCMVRADIGAEEVYISATCPTLIGQRVRIKVVEADIKAM